MKRQILSLAIAAASAVASGCGGDPPAVAAPSADIAAVTQPDAADSTVSAGAPADGADAKAPKPARDPADCDGLIEAACAMPWPSNKYLLADPTRKTGFRLQIGPTALPAESVRGTFMSPVDTQFLDGYSVGSALLLAWPSLDSSKLPDENAIGLSLDPTAAIVILEVDGAGKVVQTVPWWAERDATEADPARRTLVVRPAIALKPATRYVVGVRGLTDMAGQPIAPSPAFVALRDGKTAGSADAPRQGRFDDLLAILAGAGWPKGSLVVAWDFVTNSGQALHGRLIKMRDEGYQIVGAQGPPLKITKVTELSEAVSKDIAWQVLGTFGVPSWLGDEGDPLRTLILGADGMPVVQRTVDRPFEVRIPRSAKGGAPHGLVQYGHGLNGSYAEVGAGYNGTIANAHKLIFYACYWTGMSEHDIGAILQFIQDLAAFRTLPDKLHQGIVEQILLQRAMRERFAELPEIKKLGIAVNKDEMFYSGISQGGIYGGTVMALSKDVARGHLGVPGSNYSLLLPRSVDFAPFFALLSAFYPDSRDQQLLLQAIQLQWDAVDPLTWLRHIAVEPLPGNPPHQVLIAPAKGDWQVAVVANEIAARSGFGLAVLAHYGKPVFGVSETPYPHKGSGIVLYDHGNPWPKPGNQPPADALGDPHGKPRKLPHHQAQMVHFFRTGEIKDVCGGDGCTPD